MANVIFKKDQPIQSLSGTIGALTFRTVNGRTFVSERAEPVLPNKPTRQQRAHFMQRIIVNQCVEILQSQIVDLQEAISMRTKIRDRIVRLYKKHAPTIKARTKLQRAIMTDYYEKFAKTSSVQSRRNIGPFSDQSRY